METMTYLEAVPEYRNTLVVNLIFDFAAILILALLIIQFIRRKHHSLDLTLFFQMCLCNVFMVFVSMAFQLAPAFLTVDYYTGEYLIIAMDFIAPLINQIFSVVLLAQWFVYVEYTLHQSRDLIRRRYPAASILFIVYIVIMLIGIIVIIFVDVPVIVVVVYNALIFLYRCVLLFYIVASYVVRHKERKRNRIPVYVRLTPTTLCMIAGFAIELILPVSVWVKYEVLPFFFALGLLFADYYMYRRLSNIDPKTSFYNKKYLSSLIAYAKKYQLKGATVIRFKVQRGNDSMVSILKSWLPEQCKPITMGDGLYLLVSDAVNDNVSKRFIYFVTNNAKEQGIPVEASFETDNDAFMADILKKY